MTLLVGLAPGRKGRAALYLGATLARTSRQDVLLATVVAEPWPPNIGGGDVEYLAHQDAAAHESLTHGKELLEADGLTVEAVSRRAASVASGLLEIIAERTVDVVALGSSSSSILGRVMLGGVAERVLHGSSRPVAIAPRGYPTPSPRVRRVSVAVGRADQDGGLVDQAGVIADTMAAGLRLVCFAVRPGAAARTAGSRVEERVADEWRRKLETELATSCRRRATGRPERVAGAQRAAIQLGTGPTWAEALQDIPWTDGDVLVVGTSSSPWSRFHLGSHATKIVRNSPVPVILTARDAATPNWGALG